MRPNFATREVPGQRATKLHPPPAPTEAPMPAGAPSVGLNADASEVSTAGMVRPDHRPRADAGPRTAPRRARRSAHAQRAAGPATLVDGAADDGLRPPATPRRPPAAPSPSPPCSAGGAGGRGRFCALIPTLCVDGPGSRSPPPGTHRVLSVHVVTLRFADERVTSSCDRGSPAALQRLTRWVSLTHQLLVAGLPRLLGFPFHNLGKRT